MRPILFLLAAVCATLSFAATAQTCTNPPPTEIQNFELQTDAVIVKGFSDIGSLATETGTIYIRCKESDNVASGQKQYAISLTIENNQAQARMVLLVDYDELDALIKGLDFLSKINFNVTTMPAFDATITTRSGFRAGAHSERRQGSIQLFVQFTNSADSVRVALSPDQFAVLENLIIQAKTALDTARNKNQGS